MANYNTNLKDWGAQGTEYPDGYSYLEGDQPVDAWDNYFNYNVIEDVQHLVSLTNDRLETDRAASHPSSPEVGHLSYRTDTSSQPRGKETLYHYDNTNASWHRLLKADGDKMTGTLDMGGYQIEDTSGLLTINGPATVNGANLDTERFNKQEGGMVTAGNVTPVGTFGLSDGESLKITQATLTKDGFNTPCVSGVSLLIADESGSTTTILSGDGATLYDDETGTPIASYTNTSGGHMTVMVGLDNGHYGTGYGQDVTAYGGYIARVE